MHTLTWGALCTDVLQQVVCPGSWHTAWYIGLQASHMGNPYRQKGAAHPKVPTLLPQVQATLSALWDAFEDIAVFMEVLKVQTLAEAPRGEAPAPARACGVGGGFRVRVESGVWQDASLQCYRWQVVCGRAEHRRLGRNAAPGRSLRYIIHHSHAGFDTLCHTARHAKPVPACTAPFRVWVEGCPLLRR